MDVPHEYEYYTITIDSVGQDSSNTFTCYLTQPLRNVVNARLSAANIKTTEATQHCYLSIDELNTNFSDHTSNVFEGQTSMTTIRNTFASLITPVVSPYPTGVDTAIIFKDEYTIETRYTYPIKTIDRFRVKILNQDGTTIKNPSIAGDNFMIIRFTCLKSLY